MINGNNSYWQNASMNIRKDEDEWRIAKDTVPAPSELGTKEITENGNYSAKDDGLDGYSDVRVSVVNSYTTEDEGKVVLDGALVAQTAMPEEVTENGIINTTLYDSVTVNVSGGGGASSGKDIVFYDYDGTVVASYSAYDFSNRTEMPANPTHEGLIAQGWNWSFQDIQDFIEHTGYSKLNIGQMYITDDGKTRLYFMPERGKDVSLYLKLAENTELNIDWGGYYGNETWTSSDGDDYKSMSYDDGQPQVITITVVTGSFSFPLSEPPVPGLYKVELGAGITYLAGNSFNSCTKLSSITMPNSITSIEPGAFHSCPLPFIVLPSGVSIADGGGSIFYDCTALSAISLPNSITAIVDNMFNSCSALTSVTIPDSVTTVGTLAFSGCSGLTSITIPDSIGGLDGSIFVNCDALTALQFKSVNPPRLYGPLGISTTCAIYIPDGSFSAYTSAANYPDDADYQYIQL